MQLLSKETLNKQTNEKSDARRAEPKPVGRAKSFVERRKKLNLE